MPPGHGIPAACTLQCPITPPITPSITTPITAPNGCPESHTHIPRPNGCPKSHTQMAAPNGCPCFVTHCPKSRYSVPTPCFATHCPSTGIRKGPAVLAGPSTHLFFSFPIAAAAARHAAAAAATAPTGCFLAAVLRLAAPCLLAGLFTAGFGQACALIWNFMVTRPFPRNQYGLPRARRPCASHPSCWCTGGSACGL